MNLRDPRAAESRVVLALEVVTMSSSNQAINAVRGQRHGPLVVAADVGSWDLHLGKTSFDG